MSKRRTKRGVSKKEAWKSENSSTVPSGKKKRGKSIQPELTVLYLIKGIRQLQKNGALVTAGRAVCGGTGRTSWRGRSAGVERAAGAQWPVLSLSDLGNQLVGFFGFALRTNCFRLFAEAQRDHFKLLLAFVAFKFIDRHRFQFLSRSI